MKRRMLWVGFAGILLIIALLINPRDIYNSLKAENEIMSIVKSGGLQRIVGCEGAEVKEIRHLGGNIYLLALDDEVFLIRKEKKDRFHVQYEIYHYEVSLDRIY